MKRYRYYLMLSLLVIGSGCVGSRYQQSETPVGALLLINQGGSIDDGSFNSMAYDAIKKYYGEKALSNAFSYYVASDGERTALLMASDEQRYNLIITPGFAFHHAYAQMLATKKYLEQNYLIIDVEEDFEQPNMLQYIFKEDEGAYLAGILAATEAKRVGAPARFGFIGGMASSVVSRFEEGYIKGIKAISPDAVIKSYYTGDWSDSANAKIMAKNWYSDKVFSIMTAAGAGNGGAISAAKEVYLAGNRDAWIIGVDRDSYTDGMIDQHSVVLTSVVKSLDRVITDAIAMAEDGNFRGSFNRVGLKEQAIYLSERQSSVPTDSWVVVSGYKNRIISKEIKVDE